VRIEGADTGSGVIVRGDGIVLTSAELVGSLPDVIVTLEDGTSQTATIRGTDPVTGLAVVDLPGEGFTAAALVAPDDLAAGDTVLCAGVNDDGFTTAAGTLTKPLTHTSTPEGDPVDGVLQITPQTTTYPNLQGSAVVDGSGSVLALTTVTDGLSYYATPLNVAGKVADDLLATGSARHGWVGILGTDDPGGLGVQLTEVAPDGPAAGSLQVGDVITELGGKQVADMSTLVSRLQLHSPGDRVELTYQRDGVTAETTLKLAPLPED
jgi:S1-C subfamily serine protease